MTVMRIRSFALVVLVLALGVAGSPAAQTKTTRAVGPVTAAVRIDLFSDFQCPACKALHEQTIKRVKEEFALTGKIRLVHHDFPLPQHKYARPAAIWPPRQTGSASTTPSPMRCSTSRNHGARPATSTPSSTAC